MKRDSNVSKEFNLLYETLQKAQIAFYFDQNAIFIGEAPYVVTFVIKPDHKPDSLLYKANYRRKLKSENLMSLDDAVTIANAMTEMYWERVNQMVKADPSRLMSLVYNPLLIALEDLHSDFEFPVHSMLRAYAMDRFLLEFQLPLYFSHEGDSLVVMTSPFTVRVQTFDYDTILDPRALMDSWGMHPKNIWAAFLEMKEKEPERIHASSRYHRNAKTAKHSYEHRGASTQQVLRIFNNLQNYWRVAELIAMELED